jgi:hypothetical protein
MYERREMNSPEVEFVSPAAGVPSGTASLLSAIVVSVTAFAGASGTALRYPHFTFRYLLSEMFGSEMVSDFGMLILYIFITHNIS